MRIIRNKKGIVLLIAVLLSSIALSVGLGLSTIFLREIRIARTLMPSLRAFYAADTGSECALFEHKDDRFDVASPSNFTISCAGNLVQVVWDTALQYYHFEFPVTQGNKEGCASIEVRQQSIAPFGTCTRIDIFGRSDACGVIADNTVERGLRIYDPKACRF